MLNKPVGESIVNILEHDTVKSFIEKTISGIPVHAIITDHRREYKSIMDDFERLTFFTIDGFVSRTTNPIENYYRTTTPDSLKRIFKTTHEFKNIWIFEGIIG